MCRSLPKVTDVACPRVAGECNSTPFKKGKGVSRDVHRPALVPALQEWVTPFLQSNTRARMTRPASCVHFHLVRKGRPRGRLSRHLTALPLALRYVPPTAAPLSSHSRCLPPEWHSMRHEKTSRGPRHMPTLGSWAGAVSYEYACSR